MDSHFDDQKPSTTNVSQTGGFTVFGDLHQHFTNTDSLAQEDIKKLGGKVKQNLRQHVREKIDGVSGTQHGPVLNAVPLQLTRNVQITPQDTPDNTFLNQVDRKIRLIEHSQPFVGDVEMCDLFKFAKENAEQESEINCKTSDAKKQYVNTHGNTVGVAGIAGVGKTTLAKMMLRQILASLIIANASFIFFLTLKDMDFSQKTTLFDILFTCFPELITLPDKVKTDLLQYISSDPGTIIFIDSLDDVEPNLINKKSPKLSICSKAKPMDFIFNLIDGTIFTLAHKLVTSRPRELLNLHVDHRPHLLIEILGLNEESQKLLGQQICQDEYGRVNKTLKENPELLENCHIPVNFILILIFLLENVPPPDSMVTITDVIVSILNKYIRSPHLKDADAGLEKLVELAWTGFIKHKLVFTEVDLQEAGLSHSAMQSFLNTSLTNSKQLHLSILKQDKKSYFTHRSWQEFFVALKLIFFTSGQEFSSNIPRVTAAQWENVTKFMFGLCRNNIAEKADSLFSSTLYTADLGVKKMELAAFARTHMAGIARNMQTNILALGILSPIFLSQLFHVCACVKEMDDETTIKLVAYQLPHSFPLIGFVFPSDLSNLFFMLNKSGKDSTFRQVAGRFVGDALSVLSQKITQYKIKVSVFTVIFPLDIEEAKVVAKLAPKLDCLKFEYVCKNTLQAVSNLMKHTVIEIPNILIMNVYLSKEDIKMICSCISGLNSLQVSNCGLTSTDAIDIGCHLRSSDSLSTLDIQANPIGDAGAKAICWTLNQMATLNLANCNLTASGVSEIGKSILKPTGPQQKALVLAYNKIGNDGANFVSMCISRLHLLNIDFCGITLIKQLCNAITNLPQRMTLLSLNGNKIGDQGAIDLSCCLQNIDSIQISNCDITVTGTKALVEKLKLLSKPITHLNLSGNPISNDGALLLLDCARNVQTISLQGCVIPFDIVHKIQESLANQNLQLDKFRF